MNVYCVFFYLTHMSEWLSFVSRQEHLHVLSDDWLEDRPKPLSDKDQTAISRLEEQAEEFLHAVLCRKGELFGFDARCTSAPGEDDDFNAAKIVKHITAHFILMSGGLQS